MRVIKYGLMELAYDSTQSTLSVKWSDDLSVESRQFLDTVSFLSDIIQEEQVTNLIIDSGIPAGGVLTEEIIQLFIRIGPNMPLRKIALLESPDYLWDYNLFQVMTLLITNHDLPIEISLKRSREASLKWFVRV